MNIYLVRHTEYYDPYNIFQFRLPFYLSEAGRKHSQLIGQWFANHRLTKLPIYSSPIVRCLQTSEIIASQTKSFVAADDRLIEVNCPNLQGKTKPDKDRWIVEQDDPSREPKNKVIKRVMDIINEKVKANEECILVSHGEPLTFVYWHLTKTEFPRYPWDPKNGNKVIRKGQIVKLEFEGKTFKKATKIKL